VEYQQVALFLRKLYWRVSLFGDGYFVVRESLTGLWHCLQIFVLFMLWKLRCKYVFDQESSYVYAFFALWRDEVCHQLLAKGALLMKDAKKLDPIVYSDFN